jgi:hypothetical protein
MGTHPLPAPCSVLCCWLALSACSAPPPPRIPAIPASIQLHERRVPPPTDDAVEVDRAAAGRQDAGRRVDQAGKLALPAGARLLLDIRGATAQPATVLPLLEQQLILALMQGGRSVVEAAAVGAALRERSWDANRPRIESFDLADLLWIARDPSLRCSHVLRVRRIAVVEAEAREVDLRAVPSVQDFLARNPGLDIPATIRVPTVVGHLDLQLVEVASGEVVWLGSTSADLVDALGEAAKVRIACTRTVTNGAAVQAAIAGHNARVADAESRTRQAWGTLTRAYEERLDNETIAARRAVFDAAAAELAALEVAPPEAEAGWEYAYTSSLEIATGLGDEALAAPSREAVLIRHLARLTLGSP